MSLDHSGTWWSWGCWDQAEEGTGRQKWGFCLVAAEVSREEALAEDEASHSMSYSAAHFKTFTDIRLYTLPGL